MLAGTPIDLAVYLRAAGDIAAGRDPYATGPNQFAYLYPPAAAIPFIPLALLPAQVASTIMLALSVVALWRIVGLTAHAMGKPLTLPILALAILTEPVVLTLGYGQVNIFVVWLALEGYLAKGPVRGGILIGLAISLKLTPAIFLIPLLMRRRWAGAASTILAFLATTLVGAALTPSASLQYWSGMFADATRTGIDYPTNQSFVGAAWRIFGHGGLPVLTWILSFCVLVVMVFSLFRHRDDTLRDASVTGLAGLLISPISWTHHWIWMVPLVGWVIAKWGTRNILVWAWIFVLASWPAASAATDTLMSPVIRTILGNAYLILGVATLLALTFERSFVARTPVLGRDSGSRLSLLTRDISGPGIIGDPHPTEGRSAGRRFSQGGERIALVGGQADVGRRGVGADLGSGLRADDDRGDARPGEQPGQRCLIGLESHDALSRSTSCATATSTAEKPGPANRWSPDTSRSRTDRSARRPPCSGAPGRHRRTSSPGEAWMRSWKWA